MKEGNLSKWVARISGVRPEEGRRTLLATLFYFFFVVHVVMVKSAANALFLSRHNPLNLPYLYISVAVLVALSVLFAANTLADPRRRLLRTLSLVSVAAVLLTAWVLLTFGRLPVSPYLYLFTEVAATILNIQFWSIAGDIFDPQEGKRVFGILAGGGMAGSIVGGFLVQMLGTVIGTVNLLLSGAAALLACALLARALARHAGRADALPQKDSSSLIQGLRHVSREGYLRTFGLLMMLSMVLTSVVDYFFRISARAFLLEDQLAALFGELNFYVGVVSVVFLFTFSGRMLKRIGIFRYLMVVPAGLVVASVVSMFFPVFLAVYVLKIVENAGCLSVNQAGFQLLYNPVPTLLRASARGVIDGFMRKLGYAVGGSLLLVFAPILGHPSYEITIICLVALFLVLLASLRILYIRALDEKIRVGAPELPDLRLADAASREVLMMTLRSDDEKLLLTALQLLARLPAADLRPELPRLLRHASENVRIAAIQAVAERGYREYLFDLLAEINSGTRRARVAAVRAVIALSPDSASGAIGPYLRSSDPGLVAAAIEALIQVHGYGSASANPAIPVLEGLLENVGESPPGMRRELARLLGVLGEGRYLLRLCRFLSDPDSSVRRIAAASAMRQYRQEFVPLLLDMLSSRETCQDARIALAAYGDQVIDALQEWLNAKDRPLSIRVRIPRVLRMIGTRRAGEVLLFSNTQDDAFLRYRIALAVSGIRLQHPEIAFDRRWALEATDRRLDSYRYYARVYDQLARYLPPRSLVIRVLQDRLDQNIEVAFRVLGLIHPHRTMMSIYHQLRNARGEKWSDAMELLDNVVDHEIRSRLFPILESRRHLLSISPAMPWDSTLPELQEILDDLAESRDLLLQAATIHSRCQLGEDLADCYPILVKGRDTMTIMETVLFLESVHIFKQNNIDDLTALAAIAKTRSFQAGEFILREGEPGDALYIITRGQADITKKGKKLLTVGERGNLGSVSLLDRKPHAADAIAATACEMLVIDRVDFMDLVSDRVELLHGIFLALTERLRTLLAVGDEGALTEGEGPETASPV